MLKNKNTFDHKNHMNLHSKLHSISITHILLSSSLHIGICSISVLYNLFCFLPLCILKSAVFQFCIFYFAFLVCAYWHLQYLSFIDFTLFSLSMHIGICSISIRWTLLCFPCLCILTSAVFKSWILPSLHIHICSI